MWLNRRTQSALFSSPDQLLRSLPIHCPSIVHPHLRTLLYRKPWANFLQTSCGAFCQSGVENLYKRLRSVKLDWRHAHMYLKNLLLQNQESFEAESWYIASGTLGLPSLFKWWPWVNIWSFYGTTKFASLCICMGKMLNYDFPKIY